MFKNLKADDAYWLAPLVISAVFDIVVVIHSCAAYGPSYAPAGLLLAICSGIVGTFFGFLFGIPRSLAASDVGSSGGPARSSRRKYATNTNLEQISDWLTKAILTMSLVGATSIWEGSQNAAKVIAPLVAPAGAGSATAFVLIVWYLFLVNGFLGGYLWTRVALTQDFRESEDDALQTPEYYEGLMHAYLYRTPNGYQRTLEIAEEYKTEYGDSLTGRMCLYLACAHAQQYTALSNRTGEEAKRDAATAKAKVLQNAELSMKMERENIGLIKQLWTPGPNDDPNGDFVIFKEDAEFKALMQQHVKGIE